MTYYERRPVSPGSKEFTDTALIPGDIKAITVYEGTDTPKLALVVRDPAQIYGSGEKIDVIDLVKFTNILSPLNQVVKRSLYAGEINASRLKTIEGTRVVQRP